MLEELELVGTIADKWNTYADVGPRNARDAAPLPAEPHALPGAAVETLSSRGILLVALTEALGSDLHVDFGEPGQPGCATTARLVINPATREATFDGVAVKLTPLPFQLLVQLVQRGPRYLHATDLPDDSDLARAANAAMALSDCVRRIRNAFRVCPRLS